MTETNTRTPPKPLSGWTRFLITLLIIAGVGGFVWTQLPSGSYPTDVSRVGSGQPTLVLAYDMNYGGGMAVMELLNEIRADYAGKVDFLVAHLGMADGQAFANKHGASDGTVMLFTGDGTPGGKLYHPESVDALHQALNNVLGLERQ
jgi:hypothetical protein